MLAPTIILLSLILSSCSAATIDELTQGQVMNSSQTIVSPSAIFELGFFSFRLKNSTTQKRFYLGIWYKQTNTNSNRTIVWVGNRDQPIITNSSCFLTINSDGNLVIYDQQGVISIPITSLPSTTNVTATLLDSGNFVLRQNKGDGTNTISLLWQSFDYPTDTSLPGVKIEYNAKTGKTYKLTSWKSPDDPSFGRYSLLLDPERMAQFLILNGSQPLWTSGAWNGRNFRYTPEMAWKSRLYTFDYYSNGSENYFLVNHVLSNESILTRYVIDICGKIQQFTWVESSQSWVKYWEQPKQQCNVYSYCGSNSICDKGHYPYCKCLEGFQPSNLRDWNGGNWSSGCSRRSALQCGDRDGFLTLRNMSLPLDPKVLQLQRVEDCKSSCLGICACNAYAYSNNQCLVWYESLLNVRQADYDGEDLFLKVTSSDIKIYQESKNMNSKSLNHSRIRTLSLGVALPIIASILILGTIYQCWSKRRKSKQGERPDTNLDLMLFDFTTKTKPTKRELSKSGTTVNGGIWDIELPFFSFSSVCTATNNFSNANKIGQGGFGPVYKGILQNGYEVAIKRLSACSCQGLEELKNETTLIAKLQHRNLVKLLGCCIEGAEKILMYEYMSNKSLDLAIFDLKSQVKLSWERRIIIIEGIAQGLLYLHQYSRLRIIHRDLKASNILLDDQLNPKISDFGMARTFEDNRTQANTNRIVGTFGYMSPEYAMEGLFSIKSDVYSFGVLLLEIISGRKNSSFYPSNESSLNLIGHAWDLWQDEKELELIDPVLTNSSSGFLVSPSKFVQLALLCVQEKPSDRPTMFEVNGMLSSDSVSLPSPKQPAFCFGRDMNDNLGSGRKPSSINDVTISLTAR